jgi:hypothetical protein
MEQFSSPEQVRITQLELALDSEWKKNEKLLEKIQKLQDANLNLVCCCCCCWLIPMETKILLF